MYLFVRLIRFNSRTRAIINAVAMVAPRIFHIAALMMSIFYAFAIIGMECFDGKVYQHCCKLVVHEKFLCAFNAIMYHFIWTLIKGNHKDFMYVVMYNTLDTLYTYVRSYNTIVFMIHITFMTNLMF